MSREYTVEFEGTAVTAAVDLFEILPASNQPIEIVGLFISQSSDLGDAAEEIIRYRVIRGHTTGGSGGSAPTPRPLDTRDAASGFTSEVLNTTIASAGTAVNVHSGSFNIRAGEALWWPEGFGPRCYNAEYIVVRLMAAPTDSLTMSGTLYVREV